jgi:hypothetical protein
MTEAIRSDQAEEEITEAETTPTVMPSTAIFAKSRDTVKKNAGKG